MLFARIRNRKIFIQKNVYLCGCECFHGKYGACFGGVGTDGEATDQPADLTDGFFTGHKHFILSLQLVSTSIDLIMIHIDNFLPSKDSAKLYRLSGKNYKQTLSSKSRKKIVVIFFIEHNRN